MKDIMPEISVVRPLPAGAEIRWAHSAAPLAGRLRQSGLTRLRAANVNGGLSADRAAVAAGKDGSAGTYAAAGKRALDVLLVVISMPVTLTIILACALALWIEGGQPFYTQKRLGRGGRSFRIVKLRTMVRDADAQLQRCLQRDPVLRREWEETQKLKNDPRITPMGRLLRTTSLDELPQLWNVLAGEMSLVGPRPMLPEQLPLYGKPGVYFALKPGLTGLWQVSHRNESGFASRARADAEYCARLSLGLDLSLIWRTVGVVLRRTGY
ncbi:sugar transferase [Roseobacteraceae bacterium NS-SX3]